ncbi:MAG: aldose 1-epimerase family protein [Gracilibacteraceae bacterium]|jgi:galactose mutarotase-like enzyme|nr:aldose 1-epimerase family protein [Gracilibacteraceae bacterium]
MSRRAATSVTAAAWDIAFGSLKLRVSELGAEMLSLRFAGKELLWQGDEAFWRDRAPNLFPYIGRLSRGMYTYKGKTYRLDIHGFAKDSLMTPIRREESSICFRFESDAESLSGYPFPFVYNVCYGLSEGRLSVRYLVENTGESAMYFGIGGHPGFGLPMDKGLIFEDYYLEFSESCFPRRILFSDERFVLGTEEFPLARGRRLPLDHRLFDRDAIVLKSGSGAVALQSDKGSLWLELDYSGFPYLGIWHTPGADAPFVCLEPWSSLPSRQGLIEEITEQPGLVALRKGEMYENEWHITITAG